MTPLRLFELFLLGGTAGVLGSLVGLGGGFLAVPVLRTLFSVAPASVSGATLVMVLANALSASFAYIRQRRVDVRAGTLIAITGIPMSVLGAFCVRKVSDVSFDLLYGALLLYLLFDIVRKKASPQEGARRPLIGDGSDRTLTDALGKIYRYRENVPLLLGTGAFMGFSSSFFGIGGGLIAMPALMLLGLPAHIVTATSTFTILLAAPIGVATHQTNHDVDWNIALPLAFGGLCGGQIGPRIARRLTSPRLLTVTAVTLTGAVTALLLRHIR